MPAEPTGKQRRGRFEYKILMIKSPHVASRAEVAMATQHKLLDDLSALDSRGWVIAFIFPDASHMLMRRERPDWSPWQPGDPDDDAGELDTEPQDKAIPQKD